MKKKRTASSFTIIIAFICVALIGVTLVHLLPVKLNPSTVMPAINVTFNMYGNSARIIESEVTSKLEGTLSRVKGVRGVYSNSGEGWGNVWLDFDKHTNMEHARFEIATIVRQVWPQLPSGVSYPQVQMRRSDDESLRPFISYTINAPASPSYIQQYAEELIKPRLAELEGIYKVDLNGATPMEWRLEYDDEELTRLGISVYTLTNAISQTYRKEFLGIFDHEAGDHNIESGTHRQEWIRIVLQPSVEEEGFDASRIQIPLPDGRRISMDRLVKITRQEAAPSSYYRINGLNSVYLSVTAEEQANQLTLGTQVHSTIDEIRRILPTGYQLHLNYDASQYIQKEMEKIYFRTGLTILILLLFVWIISRNLRYTFLIATSLAINIAVAVIFYYLFKLEMQLYSLAGITISLNLIIDSTIIMADHYTRERNLKTFLSILAATLTTMGALVIIFFLDEKIRLNLQEFAAVIIINLAVSLLVSLFFVPALIDKLKLKKKVTHGKFNRFSKRIFIGFSSFYRWQIYFLGNKKKWVFLFFLFLFGLPVFMLPDKIEEKPNEETWYGELYNKTIGSTYYRDNLKKPINTALGGTWRLFVEKVYNGSYFTNRSEVTLQVNASLPNGSTLEQMNDLIKRMEVYLSRYPEIRQFQTNVQGARRASITIFFPKEHQKSSFPYQLKSQIISHALQLGGGSWQVHGLEDQGFNNNVTEMAGTYRVKLYGYNYEELYIQAERLRDSLLTRRRIKEVLIKSNFSWWKDDYQEFAFKLDKERMAEENIQAQTLFNYIHPMFRGDITGGTVLYENQLEYLRLHPRQSKEYDVWFLQHLPFRIQNKDYKLDELAVIGKEQTPQEIAKENQQYRLCLQYEYIGSSMQGYKLLEKDLERFREDLPPGYTARQEGGWGGWGKQENKQYRLLLIVAAIIFLTTGVLFNSLKKPFIILLIIPVSFIGVFLAFYSFRLNFDQGGFASFILLCGITVNATIYLLSEYTNLRKKHPFLSPMKVYLKAWNRKIIPIFLTVVSTILGFIPFMVGLDKEAFWFPLAAGTIGGLTFSVIGIYLILPLTLKEVRNTRHRSYRRRKQYDEKPEDLLPEVE